MEQKLLKMNKIDDATERQLDEEYRNCLNLIKTAIIHLNSPESLDYCRLWLEKISNLEDSEKVVRNQYLVKLCYQVQNNMCVHPFNKKPPLGPLSPLSEIDISVEEDVTNFNNNNNSNGFICNPIRKRHFSSNRFYPKSFVLHNVIQEQHELESSSWSDLSASDSDCESRILNDENNEKFELTESLINLNSQSRKIVDNDQKLHRKNKFNELQLFKFVKENNQLKRLVKVLEDKSKKDSMVKNEMQKKFIKLRESMVKQSMKRQIQITKDLEEKFHTRYQDLEQSFQCKIDTINKQESLIEKMELKYETVLREKQQEIQTLNNIIKEQSTRLNKQMKELKVQIEEILLNNNGEDKIAFLQQCVSKMDCLFQKSEKEYIREIEKLKYELNFSKKISEIKLKNHESELFSKTWSEKQAHFEKLLNHLESKYRNVLDIFKSENDASVKKYEEKINKFTNLLDFHQIKYK